jgi:hypothetical protein
VSCQILIRILTLAQCDLAHLTEVLVVSFHMLAMYTASV